MNAIFPAEVETPFSEGVNERSQFSPSIDQNNFPDDVLTTVVPFP